MRIPRHWARVHESGRSCTGWSESSVHEAEAMARARLGRLLALDVGAAPEDWDYYPATPVREELLETFRFPGVVALVTRNRAGALVLSTDRVAFVDVDLRTKGSLLATLGALFGARRGPDPALVAALARIRAWAEAARARLRVYRTARGLRLLRLDALLDPSAEECQRMFAELGADPQYARLCRAQASFRARLTPKPHRVGCPTAPGSHPRTEPALQARFRAWLERYERASAGHAVCTLVEECGPGQVLAACQALAALHEQRTVRAEEALA